MIKLYTVKNWLKKVNTKESRDFWSTNLITNLLGNIKIEKDINGKPYILNDNRFINWSHNEEYLVVALSDRGHIGIDIENKDLIYDETLYSWVLHKEEQIKIHNGGLFSEVWTRKEAILKCSGEGIYDDMSELNSYSDIHKVNSFIFDNLSISVCSVYAEPIEIYDINEYV